MTTAPDHPSSATDRAESIGRTIPPELHHVRAADEGPLGYDASVPAMLLSAGGRLDPYEILAPLGKGGMGEVYRAQDTRLNRVVAIKILTAYAHDDPKHRLRFEREARVVSSLSHPNVCVLYDVGESAGLPFLVMEYLEGETLASRLLRGPLPLGQVLRSAMEVADAIDHAHRRGVVHRDLKPSNMMLTKSGVKLLDFGLAKPRGRDAIGGGSAESEDAQTRTLSLTAEGTILGTLHYMAPEQLHGEPTDARTDIFALGAVLHEMLTGRQLFQGKSQASVMAAILERTPDPPSTSQPATPPLLDRIVARCLAKNPDERWQTASDLKQALKWVAEDGTSSGATLAPPATRSTRRRLIAAAAWPASLVLALIAIVLWTYPDSADLAAYRFMPLVTESAYQGSPAWSPDGKSLAYVAEKDGIIQVFSRALTSTTGSPVTQSRFDCRDPFWHPDNTHILYISAARESEGVWSVGVAGGKPDLVVQDATAAAISPDGRTLAFFREEGASNAGWKSFWLKSLPDGEPRRYARLPADVRFLDAALHFSPNGLKLGIWGQMYDQKSQAVIEGTDPPRAFWIVPLNDADPYKVDALSDLPPTWPSFSWLPDNRHIVATVIQPPGGSHLWLLDTAGGPPRPVTVGVANESFPAVAPDGDKVAFNSEQADFDLVEVPLDGSLPRTMLTTSRNELDPAWSPVGNRYAFVTDRSGSQQIWLRSREGPWEETPLVTEKDFGGSRTYLLTSPTFSPDGQRIAYGRQEAGASIWITTLSGSTVPFRPGEAFQDSPTWSPDGDWIAYTTALGQQWKLVKAEVGAGGPPIVLTDDITPLTRPQWSPDGRWIACDTPEGLSIVPPDGGRGRVVSEANWLVYGWSADSSELYGLRQRPDKRVLMLAAVDVRSGKERTIAPDLGPVPLTNYPVRGFSRSLSGKSFATAFAHARSDVWLLEGFKPLSLFARLWPRKIVLKP